MSSSRSFGKHLARLVFGLFALSAGTAFADSISPSSFGASLGVGDSVTVRKTVVVSSSGPTAAVVDIMFMFDTTGSMGGAINSAKSSATTVLNTLATTYSGGGGSLHSGVGQYDDPGRSILNNLTGTVATSQASINSLFACYGSCGGDFPEVGYAGIKLASDTAAWRAGSNRFILAFGDASFKTGPGAGDTQAGTAASLTAKNVKLFGVSFGGAFDASMVGLGATNFPGGGSPSTVAAAIQAAVSAGFANYGTVTVDDLDAGLSEFSVSTVCVSADTGSCVGADAVGTFDRSIDRTFEFDVTFTRLVAGDKDFDTHALVDKGIVATEHDRFGEGGPIEASAPGTLALIGAGLVGLALARRRLG